jgi:hypothetical protein
MQQRPGWIQLHTIADEEIWVNLDNVCWVANRYEHDTEADLVLLRGHVIMSPDGLGILVVETMEQIMEAIGRD